MGSDLSKSKNKRNSCYLDRDRPCSKSQVFRDLDCDGLPDMIVQDPLYTNSNFPRPCFTQPSSPASYRRSLPLDCIDLPVNTSSSRHSSRCASPVSAFVSRRRSQSPVCLSPPPSARVQYADVSDRCSNRSNRYHTTRAAYTTRRDECDNYESSRREPRSYTVSKTYQPRVFDHISKKKLPSELAMVPNERIYEIRKEKLMIKADRSESPVLRLRSKSSDRYLDEQPKTVRIVEENNRNVENNKSLKSRSSYYFDADCNEQREHRSNGNTTATDRWVYVNKSSEDQQEVHDRYKRANQHNAGGDESRLPALVNNCDIIYVPMVKEEFIKRENKQGSSNATRVNGSMSGGSSVGTSASNGLVNVQHYTQKKGKKILITELISTTSHIDSPSNISLLSENLNNNQNNHNQNNANQFDQKLYAQPRATYPASSAAYSFQPINRQYNSKSNQMEPQTSVLVDQVRYYSNTNHQNGIAYSKYVQDDTYDYESSKNEPLEVDNYYLDAYQNYNKALETSGLKTITSSSSASNKLKTSNSANLSTNKQTTNGNQRAESVPNDAYQQTRHYVLNTENLSGKVVEDILDNKATLDETINL